MGNLVLHRVSPWKWPTCSASRYHLSDGMKKGLLYCIVCEESDRVYICENIQMLLISIVLAGCGQCLSGKEIYRRTSDEQAKAATIRDQQGQGLQKPANWARPKFYWKKKALVMNKIAAVNIADKSATFRIKA